MNGAEQQPLLADLARHILELERQLKQLEVMLGEADRRLRDNENAIRCLSRLTFGLQRC